MSVNDVFNGLDATGHTASPLAEGHRNSSSGDLVDLVALVASLDAERKMQRLSWRQLADRIGVSPSLLSRMRKGASPDLGGFVKLVTWLGIPAETFFLTAEAEVHASPLPRIASILRQQGLSEADTQYLEEIIGITLRYMRADTRSGQAGMDDGDS